MSGTTLLGSHYMSDNVYLYFNLWESKKSAYKRLEMLLQLTPDADLEPRCLSPVSSTGYGRISCLNMNVPCTLLFEHTPHPSPLSNVEVSLETDIQISL